MSQKRVGLWDNPGPDEGWSWIVLMATFFVSAMMFGITTLGGSGILFTEFLHVYDLNREEAIWPFSVLGITQSVSGLLGGFLTDTFSVRGLFIFSSICCSLSLILCFWSTGIIWISFVFGALFGVGNGIVHPLVGMLVCQFFVKNQATATGIVLSSTPLAGFIFPVILNKILEKYDLRGTMLLMGGFLLNLVVASLLLRPRDQDHFPILAQIKDNDLLSADERANGHLEREEQQTKTLTSRFCFSLKRYKLVITDPMFYVVSIHAIVCVNIITAVALTLTDFVMDIGISKSTGIILLSVFAAADLLGRLFSGLISDRGYMKRKNVAALSMIVMGTSLYVVGVSNKVLVIGAITIFMGVAEGSANILIIVLYRQYMGLSRLPIALSLRLFIIGLLSICRPLLIGLFRDYLGSYIYFYYLLGGASILSGCLWLLEPLIICRISVDKSRHSLEIEETD